MNRIPRHPSKSSPSDNSWCEVTRDRPCPVCGKPDWCRVNDSGAVECHRISDETVGDFRRVGLTGREKFAVYRGNGENGGNDDHATPAPSSPPVRKTHPTAAACAAALADELGGTVGAVYEWSPTFARVRINLPGGGKTFRPIIKGRLGWTCRAPDKPHVLYRAAELPPDGPIYVCEGEKAADAGWGIGLACVTSGGSSSAPDADWSPLAGRDAVIFPDADEPGRQYARAVAEALRALNPPATVRVVELPGLPPSGDLYDFVHDLRDGQDGETIRAEVEALASSALPERGADGTPIEALLGELMTAVREGRPAVPSLKTGVELLDQAGGLACGEYMALFGPPGVGKSLVADAIALGVLDETPEATVLVFSLETAPIVRVARLACGRSVTFNAAGGVDRCIPLRPTLDGKLEAYTIERLAATAAILTEKYKGRLRFIDDATTATEIASRIRTFKPALVLVDHVGLLTPESENATFALDVGLGTMQNALRETGAAGIFIAETDKMSLKAASFGLASIRGSARVASLAGMVAVLAPDDDNATGFDPGLRFQLLKARHGRAWVEQAGSLLGGLGLVSLSPGVKPIERTKRRKKRAAED